MCFNHCGKALNQRSLLPDTKKGAHSRDPEMPPFTNHQHQHICISQNTFLPPSLRWWLRLQLHKVIKRLHLWHQTWGNTSHTRVSWKLTWIPHVAFDDMLPSLSALLRLKPPLHPAAHPLAAQQGFHQLETIPLLTALFTTLPLSLPPDPMQLFLFPLIFSSATSLLLSTLLSSTYKIPLPSFFTLDLHPFKPY